MFLKKIKITSSRWTLETTKQSLHFWLKKTLMENCGKCYLFFTAKTTALLYFALIYDMCIIHFIFLIFFKDKSILIYTKDIKIL